MPEIAPKEKRAKSSLTAFQAFFGKPCCRQTKYNSTGPKTRSKCEGQGRSRAPRPWPSCASYRSPPLTAFAPRASVCRGHGGGVQRKIRATADTCVRTYVRAQLWL